MTTAESLVASGPCPRCQGALAEHGSGLRCSSCAGIFVPRILVESFLSSLGTESPRDGYRTPSLPAGERPAPKPKHYWEPNVRYLMCPVCEKPMNRSHFARRSGVLVDVCPLHGTWFDDGEASAAAAWVSKVSSSAGDETSGEREATEPHRVPIHDQLLSMLLG